MIRKSALIPLIAIMAACSSGGGNAQTREADKISPVDGPPFKVTEVGKFAEPWAMAFLPGGKQALITEKAGVLKLWTVGGGSVDVAGVPKVNYGGQGGFGDVALHPKFAENGFVYLSYAEKGAGDLGGAAVARARLVMAQDGSAKLDGLKVIWRQSEKVSGQGHYSHRIVFSPDGYLFLSSGERQKFDPAQNMKSNLGKILRLNDDGSVPKDNPFADQGGVTAQIWSLGHRNALGLAFDGKGQLWDLEMGPKGGDELNLVERGKNYGYPIVSNGDHYDGRPIPDHDTRPEFAAPAAFWTPVISPANLMFYSGDLFPEWKGSAFAPGLSSKAIVRITFDGVKAKEAQRFDMGERIREIEQGPDGALWVLEDGEEGAGGRLLKLTPRG
ncbi:PQQ-dependent sugar dehydrogenase [Sphingobium boeckii]|uniref:Glucose/arabinose dehydrogenase n=1 Tax=Sphingobium boeckii TaxID=1082345 RepID=A0A7W9AIH2_9SPHN|nr:PQQ-dependent sugar dehydrogenase [Sphingobium boeckii]MBB5686287.1 glucose/arabinose dehydrogenase [Sphingobium boeckii]